MPLRALEVGAVEWQPGRSEVHCRADAQNQGACDFWTCSVDSAERLAIRVLTTTAPAQCAVGSAQARNQLVHGQRPGNKLHGDRFVSRLSSFECCHSTLRCGAAPTHRNGAHSNAQRMLPTAIEFKHQVGNLPGFLTTRQRQTSTQKRKMVDSLRGSVYIRPKLLFKIQRRRYFASDS